MTNSNNCNFLQYFTVKLDITKSGGSRGRGTGFLVAPYLILTCHHLVNNAQTVRVLHVSGKREIEATVKDNEPDSDLALLELPEALIGQNTLIALGTAYKSRDPFYTYGYPDYFPEGAPVTGECEGDAQEEGVTLIKFKQGQIRPGLSGSPVYNQRTQQICGVVKFTLDRSIHLGGGAIPLSNCPDRWQNYFALQSEPSTSTLEPISTPNNLHSLGVNREQFFGREEQLQQLHQILQSKKEVTITTAVVGMGGIGKTELAVQYARQFQDSYPGGVCFLNSLNWKQDLVSFARIYFPNFDPPNDLELDELVAYCWQNWQPLEGKVLVILDNLADYQQIKNYRPEGSRFKLLLTARENLGITQLALEELSDEAARNLLASFINDQRLEASEEVQKICGKLGNLPLGIELVGRYLQSDPDVSLSEMLDRLEAQALEDEALEEVHPAMTANRGIRAALELSWQRLSEPTQVVAAWLALLAEASFSWSLIEQINAIQESRFFNAKELRKSRQELTRFYLLKRIQKKNYTLHPLVREFLREKLDAFPEVQTTEYKRAYCRALVKELKQIEWPPLPEQIRAVTPIMPHAKVAAWEMTDFFGKADLYTPFESISRFYQGQGFYADAEPWYQRGCEIAEEYLEAQPLDLATSYNNLAEFYRYQGKYDNAEPLYIKALQIREQFLPTSYPELAISYHNLAQLYQDQGKYDDAENFYLKALRTRGQSLLHLAEVYVGFAELYRVQGKYDDAEPIYLISLQIKERSLLSSGIADFGYDLYLLGLAKSLNGKYLRLLVFYFYALIRQGPSPHPDIGQGYDYIARLYEDKGKYDDAEPLYFKAIKIFEQSLTPSSPDLAQSYNNLALLYYAKGKYNDAESLYFKAIRIYKEALPPCHPSLATSYHNIAKLYHTQDRLGDAEFFYLKAIRMDRQSLPRCHPNLAIDYQNLAKLYQAQGKLDDAKYLFLEACKIREKTLGTEHPKTLDIKEDYENLQKIRNKKE